MEQNLISAVITAEALAAVNAAMETIKQNLPFLVTFTDDQKKSIHKLGNTYKPFADDAAETVTLYPQIMSGTFDKEEYLRDYQLFKNLSEIDGKLASLYSAVEDTLMAAGSDTLSSSLQVYNAVQQNKKKIPGLDTVAEKMQVFFEKKKSVVPPPAK
ncbi:MAG: hypothetical protein Q8N83_08380 [Ignavibacteria bacterium]|nr:hypothetical protein [Ignavibacteria bacterium]